jgi:FkbH-like protein
VTEISNAQLAQRRRRGQELMAAEREDGRTRFAVLSSFNVDLLPPFLIEALDRSGVDADVEVGDFGQIAHQVLNPSSSLYRQEPDQVLLVPAVEDALAPLYARPPSELGEGEAEEIVAAAVTELESAVATLLERLPAVTCLVLPYSTGRAPLEAVLDAEAAERGQVAVETFMARTRALAAQSARVVHVDWDWHIRRTGSAAFTDDRLWYLGRMRANPLGLATMADLVAEHVAAYRGAAKKVAAVDLDGTIWGGIIGEAGVEGIELGTEGVGLAFQDFQRELRKLRDTGVVLVMCSKNNPEDVWEAFDSHPSMVLRRDDFAAARVNWQEKATNLTELAAELNVGIDSFVFLDDNPVERDWIRQALPEVSVPELPQDPAARPAHLRSLACFRRIALTGADRRRSQDYRAQGERRRLQADIPSFDEFVGSLEQTVTIEPVGDVSLARAAQLAQRTNQFNLTTRRYTSADIERLVADPASEVHTLALTDRFGDSGITGLVVLRFDEDVAEVETLLMSCRVLGRRVEDAFLSFIAARARARGARRLLGRYVPTAKNGQVERFFPDRGFEQVGEGEYAIDLTEHELPAPDNIDLKVPASA